MPNLNPKWCILEIDQDTNEKHIYWYFEEDEAINDMERKEFVSDLCEDYKEFILLERKDEL